LIVRTCLIVYFLLFLILLSSRNILVTTLIIILFVGIIYALYTKNSKLILVGLSIYVVLFLAILSNDITRSRIIDIFDVGKTDSQWGNISLRFQEWDASIDLIKPNIFFGVGPGDFRDELIKRYNARGWTDMAEERFNSHNQFLETLGRLGIFGLCVLLSIFFVSVREAFLKRDLLHLIFLASFVMFSLTESTLEVQKGIVFFTLFNSIFFFSKDKLDQRTQLDRTKTFV
jgi:O-antigen ligase